MLTIIMSPFGNEGTIDVRLNVDEARAIKARDVLLANVGPFMHGEDWSAECDCLSARAMVRDCHFDAVVEHDQESDHFYIAVRGFARHAKIEDDLDGTLPPPAQISPRDAHDATWILRELLARTA